MPKAGTLTAEEYHAKYKDRQTPGFVRRYQRMLRREAGQQMLPVQNAEKYSEPIPSLLGSARAALHRFQDFQETPKSPRRDQQ